MKRRKKRNNNTSGQLCLFEVPGTRQEKESRTKRKRKPAAASKPVAFTFIPPTLVKAPETPENALKTEMPDREELNRLWKANLAALHTLNRMTKKNPAVLDLVCRMALVPLCLPHRRYIL